MVSKIKLSNTLSGKKEEFKPINKDEVKIYLCGPTVYDEPHIGHLRSAYVFEVIRRYFSFRGYRVKFVRNVTDLDDKIIQKARQLSAQNLVESAREIAEKYYHIYSFWMGKVGLKPPEIEPWATDHIQAMQNLIRKLIKKGYAYLADGNVYYRVRKFKGYGKLSRRPLDEMIAGARIEPGEGKEDLLDFALWKKAKPAEPAWDSPWGRGRPGWHIECSAMSMLYLGDNFDIHCGGQDLIFPHHENEIAQSEAVTGKPFANYWLHNGMLTIEGEKMAKSLGNYVRVEDVLERFHPDVLKLFFLSVHYRNPIDFSWQKLKEIKEGKQGLDSFLSKVRSIRGFEESLPQKCSPQRFESYRKKIDSLVSKFYQAMDDDFNTALALGSLYQLLNLGNKIYQDERLLSYRKIILLSEVRENILNFGEIFSLFAEGPQPESDYNLLVEAVLKIRDKLRQEKQYQLADKIREELNSIGIVLEDGKKATSWRKVR